MIRFYKYQGAGNDFIMIDNRTSQFDGDKIQFAIRWCDRKFGIGSDGIIFIEKDDSSDFKMDFYNPDGSQSFCGNGSRCAVAFAKELEMIGGQCRFLAVDGYHEARIEKDTYHILMADVNTIKGAGEDKVLDTGSPHYIKFCDNVQDIDVVVEGQKIRYSDQYKKQGINVNFLEKLDPNAIRLRTYERGVENETLACGTGATAAALSFADKEQIITGIIDVKVEGGDLKVAFKRSDSGFTDVWLIGPAVEVFKGELNV